MENLSMIIRPISSTAVSLYPQTIYFIAMVFGVMTFGILSDIVGRKKVTHIFTFLRHRPLPTFFIIYIFFQGFDTFAGVYEHFWNDHFLYAKLEKNQCYELDALLFIKNLWNVKLAFTIDFWDKTGSTNLSQRFFPTFLLCLRSSGS